MSDDIKERLLKWYNLTGIEAVARIEALEAQIEAQQEGIDFWRSRASAVAEPVGFVCSAEIGVNRYHLGLSVELMGVYDTPVYTHPAPAAPVPASVPGPDEIDYDDPRFNQGVEHVVAMLARTIGAEGWHAGDGSEDYDCDLEETLRNILAARGLYDRDTGEFASLPEPAAAPTREETIDLTLTADFTKSLPGGALDDSTYEQIEDALDAIDAPMTDNGRYMTLVERILALKSAPAK